MKILVVFTGGTIGSTIKDGYISPNSSEGKYAIMEMFKKIQNNPFHDVEFEFLNPFYILSENLNGNNIAELISCIKNSLVQFTDIDGIIVTHGTDTLQYSAAALGLCFSGANVPIVLVSSNYILTDERANGIENFFYAVKLICEKKATVKDDDTFYFGGVYVVYKNENYVDVHYATRLLPHLPYSDFVFSVKNLLYGRFAGKGESCNMHLNRNSTIHNFSMEYIPFCSNEEEICADTEICNILLKGASNLTSQSNVLFIKSHPGQIYPDINDNVQGILIDSYHSGTLATESSNLLEFIENANIKNIPVFVTGIEERTFYESSKLFKVLGLNVLPAASPIAMYIKLWLLCSSEITDNNALVKYMKTNAGNEFV